MKNQKLIGDVRGAGLFIGVELVKDRITKEPATYEIKLLVEQMKDRGFLIGTDGPYNNVLKIKPPIIFSMYNAKKLIQNLEEVLTKL
jgi:4-aminobutyrate aminotransferase-like enzyme